MSDTNSRKQRKRHAKTCTAADAKHKGPAQGVAEHRL